MEWLDKLIFSLSRHKHPLPKHRVLKTTPFEDNLPKLILETKPVQKPWGEYLDLLREPGCVVKKIMVNPGQRPSLQSHEGRDEFWVIVEGEARVEVEGFIHNLKTKDTVFIERKAKHRVTNVGKEPLVFIETQLGNCSEDDIVRYEDDYGR